MQFATYSNFYSSFLQWYIAIQLYKSYSNMLWLSLDNNLLTYSMEQSPSWEANQ